MSSPNPMSSLDRQPATPEEFATLVENYYEQKKDYDHRILALLQRRVDRQEKKHAGETGKRQVTMPHHPAEENVTGNLTDQVAKDSKDSTASDHSLHNVDTGAKTKATAQDHNATPGPVMSDNLGKPASSAELKKQMEELNK